MSKKINLALWRWLARKKESGFALPLVLMLGLVMSIIAITMIGRSQNDQLDAVSQKKTEQVRLVTEGGIDRALTILNQARLALITDVNDDDKIDELDWENFYPYNSTKTVKELFDEAYPNTDNSTAEIVSYSYSKDTNTATLVVKGSLNDGVKTQSQIKVTIPVIIDKPDSRDSVASIIGEDIELQQSDVIGNIICSVPAVNNSSVNDGDNCQATGDNENDLRNAIGANSSNAKIIDPEDTSKTGEIKVGTVKIPDVPDSPSDATVYDLGNIYSDLKLPRSGDKPYNGVYYYEINKVDKASLLIKEDSQVRLYVKGNIELSGNDAITAYVETTTTGAGKGKGKGKGSSSTTEELKVPTPGQIRIYGIPTKDTQDFSIAGNACIMALIHAPQADVALTGGGSGTKCKTAFNNGTVSGSLSSKIRDYEKEMSPKYPNIYGLAWVKTYQKYGNSSNASSFWEDTKLLDLLVKDEAEYLENFVPPKMSRPNSWSKEAVN